jgi:hypothetical protein
MKEGEIHRQNKVREKKRGHTRTRKKEKTRPIPTIKEIISPRTKKSKTLKWRKHTIAVQNLVEVL